MAGSYDGSIRIDTSINAVPIDKGLSQIESKIKGLAATIGLAFGVKELINFGKRSIDAASDLAEAQNVVDTAFGAMSWKMEQFAATALETYGISELTAKNMGSTYMAMAKGMGVATDAASDMAVTLTGRLSDIMSFYNKTQSEVDTIGRALITGETEPLKAIGVVMTQTNLSAYAMAQGFAKTYAEMSSNEQLLVRYKYFLEQTSLAQGDFAKTSEGWANQTRLLSERINEFMTNLGGVIMNVLTPALQFANEAVTFLNDLFFGGKTEEETTAAKNAEAVTDEITAVGAAADKSKKKLNNLLSGFDELHIISGAKSDDEESFDAGIDTSNLLGVNLDADTSTAKKAAQKYRDIINEIYLAFKRHPLTKAIEDIIKGIGKFFGFIKDNGDISAGDIVTALMDILAAIIAYKTITGVVGGVTAFSKSFGSLIGLITAHPVVAAVAGITALTIGIIALDDELKRQRIASHFGDISISLEEIDELTSPIKGDVDELVGAFQDNDTRIKTARDNFIELSKAIESTTDALGQDDGSGLDKFIEQVDEYVNAALDLTDATNDTSALRQLYMADGIIDETEQSSLDKISSLNDSIKGKIETIREQIHSITKTAAEENRKLTEAEIENIKHLYDELARITATQGDVEQTAAWERLITRAYSYESYDVLLDEISKAREQTDASLKEIEDAAIKQMRAQIVEARNNGDSEEDIQKLRDDTLASINKSIDEKKKQSLEYELKLLNAFGEAHYGFTEETELEKLLKSRFNTDEERERFKQYYELYKEAQNSGSDVDINSIATAIGDERYAMAISDLAGAIKAADKTYGDWGAEHERVVNALSDLGYDSADSFTDSFFDIIESSPEIDATTLLSDVTEFSGKGKSDGAAYINALTEYISSAEIPWKWGDKHDGLGTDEYIAKYSNNGNGIPQQSPAPTPSSYASQVPYAAGMQPVQQEFTFPIIIDGVTKETVKTDTETVLRPNWHDPMKTNGG